jgi:hypothetical protein
LIGKEGVSSIAAACVKEALKEKGCFRHVPKNTKCGKELLRQIMMVSHSTKGYDG